MARINQNNLARDVTIVEAGRFTINNGQTKEIMRIIWDILTEDYGTHGTVNLEIIKEGNKFKVFAR